MLLGWDSVFALEPNNAPRKGIVGPALRTVALGMGRGGRWRARAECDRRGSANMRRAGIRPWKRIGV